MSEQDLGSVAGIKKYNELVLAQHIVTTSQDMLSFLDANLVYQAVNPAYTEAFGMSAEDIIGLTGKELFGEGVFDEVIASNVRSCLGGGIVNYQAWFDFPNKKKSYMDVYYYPYLDDLDEVIGLVVSARDITRQKEIEDRLEKNEKALQRLNKRLEGLSNIDSLTGLANRRMLDASLTKEWNRCMRWKHPFSVLMIDIDFFKPYNDYYGHLKGDDCLIMVAQEISEVINRPADLVSRYGGEEFVILLPETDGKNAALIAEKCRSKIFEQQITHEGSVVGDVLTISVGVSTIIPSSDIEPYKLIETSDRALYWAKDQGRNQVRNYKKMD